MTPVHMQFHLLVKGETILTPATLNTLTTEL